MLETKNIMESLNFSNDTKYFLTGGQNKKITVWKMIDMKLVCSFGTDYVIRKIIISRDN